MTMGERLLFPGCYPQLIALYSPAPQSGKSTFADALVSKGYTVCRFADPLKRMIETLLLSCGATKEMTNECVRGSMKEHPLGETFGGKTTRDLMDTLGTIWGRQAITPDLWVNIAKAWISHNLDGNGSGAPRIHFVVDDMRFPNEFQAMKDLGAITVKIVRPGAVASSKSNSEGHLDQFTFDHEVINDSDVTSLQTAAWDIINEPVLSL